MGAKPNTKTGAIMNPRKFLSKRKNKFAKLHTKKNASQATTMAKNAKMCQKKNANTSQRLSTKQHTKRYARNTLRKNAKMFQNRNASILSSPRSIMTIKRTVKSSPNHTATPKKFQHQLSRLTPNVSGLELTSRMTTVVKLHFVFLSFISNYSHNLPC